MTPNEVIKWIPSDLTPSATKHKLFRILISKVPIEGLLPPNYGEVSIVSKTNDKIETGIVVPVCGRPNYLRRCLESLARSHLPNCAICLIDETCAQTAVENFDGFVAFPGLDSPGSDLEQIDLKHKSLAQLARENSSCVAFTSRGELKSSLSWLLRKSPTNTLFIKKEIASSLIRGPFWRWQRPDRPDPEASDLLRQWECPSSTVIKIYKHRHRYMFDSLYQGFELLNAAFCCPTLVCLDSDTIVKPEWLNKTQALYRRLKEQHQLLLASGFHTTSHPTLVENRDHRIKASLGGIHLMFDQPTWKAVVRPSLTSLQWDLQACESIRQQGGALVVTRPSVVQHIGRSGLWSNPLRYDRADDF